jgi:O-antigen/teichoic acid export membrane protein
VADAFVSDEEQAGWRNCAGAAAALLAAQALGMFSALILPRYLGVVEYGRVGLALTFGIYSYQLIQWGVDPHMAALLARAEPDAARCHIAACLRMKIVAAVIVLALGAALVFLFQPPPEQALIFIGLVDGALLAFSMPGAFDARLQTARFFVFSLARQALYLCVLLAAALFFPERFTAAGVLVLHAACVVPQVVLEWRWITKTYGAPPLSGAGGGAADMWRAALPLGISAAAWQLSLTAGPPILFALGGGAELGVLCLSNQIATVLHSFTTIPARQVQVRLAVQADGPGFRAAVWRQMLIFVFFGAVAATACSIMAVWAVPFLWGRAFAPAAALVALDAWRVAGTLAGGVASAALICRGRRRAIAVSQILALLVTLAVALLFGRTHGAWAMVAAVLAGRVAFAVFAATAFALDKSPGKSCEKDLTRGSE